MIHPYRANAQKVTQLLAAGFVSTIAMLVVGVLALLAGLPSQDFAALSGAALSGEPVMSVNGGVWWLGLFTYFISGTILFPLAYDFLIDRHVLPNRPRAKGALFGWLVWVLLEIALKPVAGAPANLIIDLLTCGFYGVVLEAMTRVPIVHELRLGQKKAA